MAKKKAAPGKRDNTWYGWKPDLPDHRDFSFTAKRTTLKKLPKKVDLRKECPPIYDQGQLGSCTGNAIAAAIEFGLKKQNPNYDFMPSRLFIYYGERVIEGTVNIDNGAEIRNGIKVVNRLGVCSEKMWKYSGGKVLFKRKPPVGVFKEALNHQVLTYSRVNRDLKQMKACLAEGFPFVFGFTVYDEFEGDEITKTGVLHLPGPKEEALSGHAVLCVGYDDASKRFIIRNSWNTDWGQEGYFTMPYEYLLHPNLADDFWTIRMVEVNEVILKAAKKKK
jgi:C1A family cysteine protease